MSEVDLGVWAAHTFLGKQRSLKLKIQEVQTQILILDPHRVGGVPLLN